MFFCYGLVLLEQRGAEKNLRDDFLHGCFCGIPNTQSSPSWRFILGFTTRHWTSGFSTRGMAMEVVDKRINWLPLVWVPLGCRSISMTQFDPQESRSIHISGCKKNCSEGYYTSYMELHEQSWKALLVDEYRGLIAQIYSGLSMIIIMHSRKFPSTNHYSNY